MALYRYEALNEQGQRLRGSLDAGTPAEARAALRSKGCHATHLEPALAARSTQELPASGVMWRRIGGKHLDQLAAFSRQLALLLKAGVPLAQSLAILSEQIEDRRFCEVIKDLAVRVREGAALDEALAVHPRYFPEIYICVARAGAASGSLAHLLIDLSGYYTRQKRLRDRVISALTYPALMGLIGVLVLAFLLAYVVPKVTTVLLEQNRVLPWPTELLLSVSGLIQNNWWMLLPGAAFLGWLASAILRAERGRRGLDKILLALPIVGDLYCKQAVARWADTMSNLLVSGIPVAQALSIVRGVLGNRLLAEDLARLEKAVIDGRDLSEALKNSATLPKSIAFIVGVGEESGELAKVLRDVADSFNEEVELTAGRLTELVNPVLIVFLGAVVFFIVAAILLPITDFSQIQ
jgi:general secretion pathway protein F